MDNQNPQAAESQETLVSLQQVEPSPIESPLDLNKQLPNLPPPVTASRTSTLGLSGTGHGAVYYLTRLQRYSSYVFTIYTAFHLTNTSLIPLLTRSVPASEPYLLLTRPYYQSPLTEPLLITLPLFTHLASGFLLRIHRRNASLARYGARDAPIPHSARTHTWPPLSYASISGYILAPLVLGHVFVNRLLPWWVEGGSSGVGLGFVSHGFAKHPFLAGMGYVALIGVAAGHVVWGWAKWLGWTPLGTGKAGRRRWWVVNGAAVALAGLWAAGGLGVVARGGKSTGWVGKGYDELYARVPFLDL